MSATFRKATIIALLAVVAARCNSPETSLQRLAEAQRLSSDLLVLFTKAADAGNRAVMGGTEDAASASAREAEDAMQEVQKNIATLRLILTDLRYSAEVDLLEEFARRFAEYRTLDQNILELAVENTNFKAQRLSFGTGRHSRPTRSETRLK